MYRIKVKKKGKDKPQRHYLAVELLNMARQCLGRLEDVIAVGADQFRWARKRVVQRIRDTEQVLCLSQHVGLQFRLNSIEIVHFFFNVLIDVHLRSLL